MQKNLHSSTGTGEPLQKGSDAFFPLEVVEGNAEMVKPSVFLLIGTRKGIQSV